MAYIPAIGLTGLWTLQSPFQDKLLAGVAYECIAVRRLVDIAAAGDDPKQLYYTANALTDEQYAADAAAGVCIVTLQSGAVSTVYVPSSFLSGQPQMGGVPYTQLLLACDLGALPNTSDLSLLLTKIADVVREHIGVTTVPKIVVASPTTVLTDEQHAVVQAARELAIEVTDTDYSLLLQAQAQVAALEEKNAELVSYIETLNLPASLVPPMILAQDHPNTLLQLGNDDDAYWLEDGVWAPAGLARGQYTGLQGSQYEQRTGISQDVGPNGEVSARMTWGWPHVQDTEVKTYISLIKGAKPGLQNSWVCPGGETIILPSGEVVDGSDPSHVHPSGPTPGTFFPLQVSAIDSLKTSFGHQFNAPPTGQGQLVYDLWFQSSPAQRHGFNADGELDAEVMIALDNWGDYGTYGHRNHAWYDSTILLDGRVWHVYVAKDDEGNLIIFPPFNDVGWHFFVFQPAQPIIHPGELNLKTFADYLTTRQDTSGTPWLTADKWLVSSELGIEVVEGTGDLTVYNHRVYQD